MRAAALRILTEHFDARFPTEAAGELSGLAGPIMYDLNLGYFRNFRGRDTVLLEGTSDALNALVVQLASLEMPERGRLAIHEIAEISPSHPAKLFAHRHFPRITLDQEDDATHIPEFHWWCSESRFPAIKLQLRELILTGEGHCLFDLALSEVRLVISLREYGESWWAKPTA
jgi:hypothetical protein